MSLKGLGFVTKVKAYIKKPQGINSYMKKWPMERSTLMLQAFLPVHCGKRR